MSNRLPNNLFKTTTEAPKCSLVSEAVSCKIIFYHGRTVLARILIGFTTILSFLSSCTIQIKNNEMPSLIATLTTKKNFLIKTIIYIYVISLDIKTQWGVNLKGTIALLR